MRESLSLKKAVDFQKAFKEGRRFVCPRFVIYVRKNNLVTARFGTAISKRHFKLATRRNKIKRVAKELFRKDLNGQFKGFDFVLASRVAKSSENFNKGLNDLKVLMHNLNRKND